MPHIGGGGVEGSADQNEYDKVIDVSTKTQVLLYLIVLSICDIIIPLPLTAMMLIMVLYRRPQWFRDLVREIYRS